MICKYCGTEIAAKALICYKCGNATTEPRIRPPDEGPILGRPRRSSRLPYVAIVIILALALLVAVLHREVAEGHDADQAIVLDDRQPPHLMFAHELRCFARRHVRTRRH